MIETLPFFTPEHRKLAKDVDEFVKREIEPHANDEQDIEGLARHFVEVLAKAGLLGCCVPLETKIDSRTVCLIREKLASSSSLADLAFVMQGTITSENFGLPAPLVVGQSQPLH